MTNKSVRFWKLEQAIAHIDEAARLLHSLRDPVIDNEVMRHLEGKDCGWSGRLLRDILEERLEVVRRDLLK